MTKNAVITGKQATLAVREIRKRSGWSLRYIAVDRLGWPYMTLHKIYTGTTKNPAPERMEQISELLDYVRAHA